MFLARIDDRDYQAQLRQLSASRDVAKANLHLLQDKADRARLPDQDWCLFRRMT